MTINSEHTRVILCWLQKDMEGGFNIHSIAYNSGAGKIRVYEKDKYDARVMPDLPFFDTAEEAFQHMKDNNPYMMDWLLMSYYADKLDPEGA